MKKVVFIADKYYVNKSAIANCIKNILPIFNEKFKVYVVTQNQDHLDTLQVTEDGADIILVNTKIINIETKAIKTKNPLLKKALNLLHFAFLVQSKLCQPRRGYYDNKRAYVKALESIGDIDYIVPTCMPIETCHAAMDYCKVHTNCEYFPLMFDLFAHNRNHLNGVPFKKHRQRVLNTIEYNVLKYAKRIFICNSWNKLIPDCYPEFSNKCISIEHPLVSFKADALNTGDNKTALFAGSLLSGHNDITGFLQIFKNLKDHNLNLDIYSNLGKIKSDSNNICYHEWVTHAEYINNVKNCLFVVSLSEFNGVQLCSKIFDCISYAKPVVQVVFSHDDANIKFLSNYPASLVLCVNDDISENVNKLSCFIDSLKNMELDFEKLKQDFIELTPEYVANTIIDGFEE